LTSSICIDTQDDPLTEDTVLSVFEYERRLSKRALAIQDALGMPAVLAVQEVENYTDLGDLAARPELQGVYEFVWFDSPDRRGIDNAVLYRPEQVSPLSAEVRQGCTPLIDSLGPDENGDPLALQNTLTCDINADGVLDGNRLFSRPPLVVRMQILGNHGPGELWLIANHWKSKSEDTSTTAYTLPRRIEQARFVAGLAAEIQALDPDASIMLLGDLNDTLASAPLAVLTAAGMVNLWERLPPTERYSYIYQGYLQAIDHILVSGPWLNRPGDGLLWAARINADYPARYTTLRDTLLGSSDHDPLLARFSFFSNQAFLPLIRTSGSDAVLRMSSP
jgi:predicted extracellular nuclease